MNEAKKMANIEKINGVSFREKETRPIDRQDDPCLKNHYYYLLYVTEKKA